MTLVDKGKYNHLPLINTVYAKVITSILVRKKMVLNKEYLV